MTARECFVNICRFERADCPVKWETLGFWGQTVVRWREEGLPEGVNPHNYFDMDPRVYVPNTGFTGLPYFPRFEADTVIAEEGATRLVRGSDGIVKRERSDHPELSMPQWVSFPVKSRADWEEIRDKRLDASTPGRYPDWDEIRAEYATRTIPYGMTLCGAYGTPRNLFGEEGLAYVYFDDPRSDPRHNAQVGAVLHRDGRNSNG